MPGEACSPGPVRPPSSIAPLGSIGPASFVRHAVVSFANSGSFMQTRI